MSLNRIAWVVIGGILLRLIAANASHASDGVVEINQTCALNGGCFSGDGAGFPILIDGSAGRSYRLTSNLIQPTVNNDVIRVSAPSVTIDLNGFEIVRTGCEGATSDCTPTSGTGSAIERLDATIVGTKVINGSVTGMGRYGLRLGPQAEVVNVRARWNRVDGIFVGVGSSVSRSVAYQNGDDGIEARAGSLVFDNSTWLNDNDGIVGVLGSNVFDNSSAENADDGISAGDGVLVRANTVRENGDFGLTLGVGAAYRENVVDSASGGGTVAGGVNAGANACDGSTTCP